MCRTQIVWLADDDSFADLSQALATSIIDKFLEKLEKKWKVAAEELQPLEVVGPARDGAINSYVEQKLKCCQISCATDDEPAVCCDYLGCELREDS
jgi:hypothetical protein